MSFRVSLNDAIDRLDEVGPLFILGCPRSGTTFVYNALRSFNRVVSYNGVLAAPSLLHLLGLGRLGRETREEVLWGIRRTFWKFFLNQRNSWGESFLEAIRGNLSWTEVPGRHERDVENFTFLYKEPFLCFAVEAFADHFGGARFLHIVRDGRDCADSLAREYSLVLTDEVLKDPHLSRLKAGEIGSFRRFEGWCVPWWVPDGEERWFVELPSYGRCVWLWKAMVSRVLSAEASGSSDRFLRIRYEDMVRSPQETLERLAGFLDWSPERRFVNKMHEAHDRSVGIHAENQPADRLAIADEVAGNLLDDLGYVD